MEMVTDPIQETFYAQGDSTEDDEDPFHEKDDALFREKSSKGQSVEKFEDSPVTSPQIGALHKYSRSYNSSRSSTNSCGRISLKWYSRRLSPSDGLGLFKRSSEVLRRSKDTRSVEQSIRTIRELLDCGLVGKNHVLGSGIVQTVCSVLASHGVLASLAEECSRFISLICDFSAESRDIADEFNAICSLRAILETHFELYSNTIDAAMHAIGILCKHSTGARAVFFQLRGLEWILVCSKQWRSARTIQISAFACLHRAIFQKEESQQRVIFLGVLEELFIAMQTFEEDSTIQQRALSLLNTLIGPSFEFRCMSVTEGLVERVVFTLKTFPGKTEVISPAARASEYYCRTSDGRSRFVSSNGPAILLQVFKRTVEKEPKDDRYVHKMAIINCLRAFKQVSHHLLGKALARGPNVVSTILCATHKYSDDVLMAECASVLYRNLSYEKKAFKKDGILFSSRAKSNFSLEDLIAGVTFVLCRHVTEAYVAENCLVTLLTLCDQGRKEVLKRSCPNLSPTVHHIVETHSSNNVVIRLGVSLLAKISS